MCKYYTRDVIPYQILTVQALFTGEELLEGDWAPVIKNPVTTP